jgi:hypothetical protein
MLSGVFYGPAVCYWFSPLCDLPVHKKLLFIDTRANFQSRNNINTLIMITTMDVMSNTEFTMIQTFTNNGFSWGQRKETVIPVTNWMR